MFFLVEAEKHNARMLWLDNTHNSFACKYACSQEERLRATTVGNTGADTAVAAGGAGGGDDYYSPAILHFVGVDKPSTLFVHATHRSRVVNALTKIDVAHAFVADHVQGHYQRWFEHLMGGLLEAFGTTGTGPPSSAAQSSQPVSSFDGHSHSQLLWHEPLPEVSPGGGKGGGNGLTVSKQQASMGGKRWVAFLHVPST